MAYISHVVTEVWCGEVGICDDRVCVLFVSSRSDIVFNSSASAITDHSQSAKDIDLYFKSQLYADDPGRRKTARIHRIVNPESKCTTEIIFLPWIEFEPTTS